MCKKMAHLIVSIQIHRTLVVWSVVRMLTFVLAVSAQLSSSPNQGHLINGQTKSCSKEGFCGSNVQVKEKMVTVSEAG